MLRSLLLVSFCALNCCLASHLRAQPLEWNKATGTHGFSLAGNWDPNMVPTSGDDVTFGPNLPGMNVQAVLGAASESANMTFTDGAVEFVGFGGAQLDNTGTAVIDDVSATALANGALVTLNGSAGVVWNSTGDATVGNMGYGTLTVNNGGDYNSANLYVGDDLGSVGEINIVGAGSSVSAVATGPANGIFIGNAGMGTVNVTGGGLLQTTDLASGADISLGFAATGVGHLNVSGGSSRTVVEDLFVGEDGEGHLTVSAGGVIDGSIGSSPDAFMAANSGSSGSAVVSGDGSQWLMNRLEIGNAGDATLSIEAGGLVRSKANDMTLADAGGSGRVAVFGGGTSDSTLDVTNDLYVGNLGLGELFVGRDLMENANGRGTLTVGNALRIGTGIGSTSDNRVIFDGANVSVSTGADLTVGENADGRLEVRGGANVMVGGNFNLGLFDDSRGIAIVDGANTTVTADILFAGNDNNDGNPSGSVGELTVSGGARVTLTNPISGSSVSDAVTLGDDGNGRGTLNIMGANSIVETTNASGGWFIGGSGNENGGTGFVSISAGGLGTSASRVILAHGSGSRGTLSVTGANSRFEANGDYLIVGSKGLAGVGVLSGGTLTANGVYVSEQAGSGGSVMTVQGVGSNLTTPGRLWVGNGDQGSLHVTNGATVSVGTLGSAERPVVGVGAAADASLLRVDGVGSRVDFYGAGDVSIGYDGGSISNPATLQVTAGGVFSAVHRDESNAITNQARILVGDRTGSHGRINLNGAGSRIEAGRLFVGDGDTSSTGVVNIVAGGVMEITQEVEVGSFGAAIGNLNVDGATSRLEVGTTLSLGDDTFNSGGPNGAEGFLNITAGGTVTNGGSAYIGHYTGSEGTAVVGSVTSNFSEWTIGNELTLAGTEASSSTSGFGVLSLNPGGRVEVGSNVRIRNRGTVNVDGGELRFGGDLIFTDAGSTLNFNTGTLRSTNASGYTLDGPLLDRLFGPSPAVGAGQRLVIDGAATISSPVRLNGGELSVGTISSANFANVDFDAGTLSVTNQNVVVGSTGLLGSSAVLSEPQTLRVPNNNLTINAGSDLNVIRGGLSVQAATNNGLLLISNTTDVEFTGANGLTNNGQLVVIDSTIAGPVDNSGGELEIVGTVNFLDGLTLAASSSLDIDLYGTSSFDALSVGGDASLGGLLEVSVSGFSLAAGQAFEILDIDGSQSGTFAGLADGGLVGNYGGLNLFIDYDGGDGNDVVLFTAPSVGADFDLDGDVDGNDFLLIQRNSPTNIGLWQQQYGVGALAAASAVPEPSTLVGCVMAATLITGIGRSKK